MPASGTVLIVDHDQAGLRKLAEVLEFDGYNTARAIDAEEAARFLRYALPDVVLVATDLPGMGGLELVKLMKSNPAARGIAVIAMLEADDSVDVTKVEEAGCDGAIGKPVDFRVLSRQIEACRTRPGQSFRPRVGDAPVIRSFRTGQQPSV